MASPSRLPTAIENVATMTVSEPEAAWASCGLYSNPLQRRLDLGDRGERGGELVEQPAEQVVVMEVSIAVIGRLGCSALPEPPSMWSTMAMAMSSG